MILSEMFLLFMLNGSGFVLDYKVELASKPGQPGSVEYYTIWVGDSHLRRDINQDVSTIINLGNNVRWEINHLNKTYESIKVDSEPEDILFKSSWPPIETVNAQPCDVYETQTVQQNFKIEIKIWISKKVFLSNGKNILELLTNQSLDRAFGGKVPEGVPVKFSVKVFQKDSEEVMDAITIQLESQKKTEISPDKFEVPLGYDQK